MSTDVCQVICPKDLTELIVNFEDLQSFQLSLKQSQTSGRSSIVEVQIFVTGTSLAVKWFSASEASGTTNSRLVF